MNDSASSDCFFYFKFLKLKILTINKKMGRNGNTCAVAICPSPQEATYHVFPKDERLQKLWVDLCKRKETINIKTARICSSHFKEEDYERDLKNELLGLPIRKLLKSNSVPSKQLLPGIINNA